jgi:hypothetical protein
MKCLEGANYKHNYRFSNTVWLIYILWCFKWEVRKKSTAGDTLTPVCNVLLLAQKKTSNADPISKYQHTVRSINIYVGHFRSSVHCMFSL